MTLYFQVIVKRTGSEHDGYCSDGDVYDVTGYDIFDYIKIIGEKVENNRYRTDCYNFLSDEGLKVFRRSIEEQINYNSPDAHCCCGAGEDKPEIIRVKIVEEPFELQMLREKCCKLEDENVINNLNERITRLQTLLNVNCEEKFVLEKKVKSLDKEKWVDEKKILENKLEQIKQIL